MRPQWVGVKFFTKEINLIILKNMYYIVLQIYEL